ncbi:ribonuclease H [Senna tora]|uniref:Ribonuclease H n=1 Tax=Senna tora TaxID=362788 RepID=A0A834W699_9FABA|nr:ribonuclease H [Senna tora]
MSTTSEAILATEANHGDPPQSPDEVDNMKISMIPRSEEWMENAPDGQDREGRKMSYRDSEEDDEDIEDDADDLDDKQEETEGSDSSSADEDENQDSTEGNGISVEKDYLDRLDFKLSDKEWKRVKKPFKKALIIKLLGKTVGFKFLLRKQSNWKSKKNNPVFEVREEQDKGKNSTGEDRVDLGTPVKGRSSNNEETNKHKDTGQGDALVLGTPVKEQKEVTKSYLSSGSNQVKTHNPKDKPPDTSRKKISQVKGLSNVVSNVKGSKKEDTPPRGVAGRKFSQAFNEIKRCYNPELVFLFETRCSGLKVENTIRELGYSKSELCEARGFAGGIWALWNNDTKVTCVKKHDQFMQIEIENQKKERWGIIDVYAKPHVQTRDELWPIIKDICINYPLPLLVANDFNEIANQNEQRGGASPNLQRCFQFQSWINSCNIIDLYPAGPFFTWEAPKRQNKDKLYKRLDRAMCTQSWRNCFAYASARCLTRVHYDHNPILISTEEGGRTNHNRPFRFEFCWMQHREFIPFLESKWEKKEDLNIMLKSLGTSLKDWNREVFGNIKKRKERLIRRIDGIHASLDRKYNPCLDDLGKELEKELGNVLNQEESLWFQRARCQWIKDGVRNTKYYHTKVLTRRRRNKIIMLKNDDGVWTEDFKEIKNIILEFYKKIVQRGYARYTEH